MTLLNALGDFPEMVLGLAFSLACALLLAFLCLRLLLSLMTRQQYNVARNIIAHNVINDPSHTGSIIWLGVAVAGASAAGPDAGPGDGLNSSAARQPVSPPCCRAAQRFRSTFKP